MNDIVKVMKKYEDEFDVIHGLGKLEIFDELLQGNEAERDRNLSISATYESAIPLIKVELDTLTQNVNHHIDPHHDNILPS